MGDQPRQKSCLYQREIGPTGGNMRYDAVASISCIDKALHASVIHL